jgi:cytochrome c-type biogenesis protein CcmH
MRVLARRFMVVAVLLLAAALHNGGARPAFAVEPGEMLADPKLEARARALSGEFRCLVCQNESIDESNADLAHDLRVLIRQQIKEGQSDAQIRSFLVARYGQFVLLKPRFEPETMLLWLGPFIVLVLGAAAIAAAARRRREASEAALSEEEREKLGRLTDRESAESPL